MKLVSKYFGVMAIVTLTGLFGCSKNTGTPETLSAEAKWCTNHLPGQRLSYADFKAKRSAINPNSGTFSQSGYESYLAAVDRDAVGVLYRIFSEFNSTDSHVWYGSFNAIGTKYSSAADKGEGFRVVGKRVFTDTTGKQRLALVIAFWTYRNGKLQLKGGPDSLRVRLQIEDDSAESKKGNFAAISYHLDLDESGKVKAIKPTVAYDSKGDPLTDVTTAAIPSSGHDRCFYCHSDSTQTSHHGFSGTLRTGINTYDADFDLRNDVVDESKVTPETMASIKAFTESMSSPGPELAELFKTPKTTFVAEGLLKTLAERCDAIGKADKK